MAEEEKGQKQQGALVYKKLYSDLFVEGTNLLKVEKEELQEYIYDNYRDFIALQGEYDEFYKQFGEIKSQFSAFENALSYIFENVSDVKKRKLQQQQQKQQQLKRAQSKIDDSDTSDDDDVDDKSDNTKSNTNGTDEDNEDDYENINETDQNSYARFQQRQKAKKEKQEIAEQINELLDSVSIFTFEKNYSDATKNFSLMQDMLSSEKYSVYLSQHQIRKTLEQHYQVLTDSLISDLVSENPLTKQNDLIGFLKQIRQTARAAEGYLEVQKRKLAHSMNISISKVGKLEGERTEKLTEEYVNFVLAVSAEYQIIFPSLEETDKYLRSFLSNWVNQSCSVFFYCIQQNVFWGTEIEDILENVKIISNVLFEKEQKNLSLNFIMQRLFIDEIQLKMDDMFMAYAQRLTRLQNQDDWQVYPIFSVLNVNFCEEEISNPNLQPVKFISELDTQEDKKANLANYKTIKEVKITDLEKGYQSYIMETQLKGARHAILFWNTIFQLMDKVIDNVDVEQRRIFSSQFVAVVENKILQFLNEYIISFKEVLSSIAGCSESQLLAACANINTCLALSKLGMEYEVIKLSPHIRLFDHEAWQNSWKLQVNDVYTYSHDLFFTYFKFKLLNHLPRMFSDYRKVYTSTSMTKSNTDSSADVKTPSPLFLKIAAILDNIKDNLYLIMSQTDIMFYLHKLFSAINYVIEYIIYWDYHSNNKNSGVFFMHPTQIAKIGMDMSNIDVFLAQNALEIKFFAKENIKQFVFDMHFLATLYNAYFAKDQKQDKKISNEEFLKKALSCYCKKQSFQLSDFQYSFASVKDNIQMYCVKEFKTDVSSFILKERETLKNSMAQSQMQQYQSVSSNNSGINSMGNSSQSKGNVKERIFAINLTINKQI